MPPKKKGYTFDPETPFRYVNVGDQKDRTKWPRAFRTDNDLVKTFKLPEVDNHARLQAGAYILAQEAEGVSLPRESTVARCQQLVVLAAYELVTITKLSEFWTEVSSGRNVNLAELGVLIAPRGVISATSSIPIRVDDKKVYIGLVWNALLHAIHFQKSSTSGIAAATVAHNTLLAIEKVFIKLRGGKVDVDHKVLQKRIESSLAAKTSNAARYKTDGELKTIDALYSAVRENIKNNRTTILHDVAADEDLQRYDLKKIEPGSAAARGVIEHAAGGAAIHAMHALGQLSSELSQKSRAQLESDNSLSTVMSGVSECIREACEESILRFLQAYIAIPVPDRSGFETAVKSLQTQNIQGDEKLRARYAKDFEARFNTVIRNLETDLDQRRKLLRSKADLEIRKAEGDKDSEVHLTEVMDDIRKLETKIETGWSNVFQKGDGFDADEAFKARSPAQYFQERSDELKAVQARALTTAIASKQGVAFSSAGLKELNGVIATNAAVAKAFFSARDSASQQLSSCYGRIQEDISAHAHSSTAAAVMTFAAGFFNTHCENHANTHALSTRDSVGGGDDEDANVVDAVDLLSISLSELKVLVDENKIHPSTVIVNAKEALQQRPDSQELLNFVSSNKELNDATQSSIKEGRSSEKTYSNERKMLDKQIKACDADIRDSQDPTKQALLQKQKKYLEEKKVVAERAHKLHKELMKSKKHASGTGTDHSDVASLISDSAISRASYMTQIVASAFGGSKKSKSDSETSDSESDSDSDSD